MILHEQVLKLGHGAIGVIEDGAFIGLVSLRELSLTNCKLREMLPLGQVKDSLETLELRRNSLSSTTNDYFNNFRKLHTINLGNNSLEVAPNVSALNDQLKTLQIPFNKITVLDSLISAVYPQLFRLDVAGNRLTQLTRSTVYLKKYAHGFCFAVLCCGYTLTDFPISIRLTSLALRQSNDCPSASKATLMNMDKCFMWIHYERLHNHNKAKHNKTVCIFLGIYCMFNYWPALRYLYLQDNSLKTIENLSHLAHAAPLKVRMTNRVI